MPENITPVYVEDDFNKRFEEIQPEYVYMTIPAEYVCIYHRILVLFAEYGVDILKDCQAACNSKNRKIVDCFNTFNAAIAARKLGQDKLAETLIKYIEGNLKMISSDESLIPNIVFPVDEKGYLKAVVGCNGNPRFMVDVETGELWKKQQSEKDNTVYALDETDIPE